MAILDDSVDFAIKAWSKMGDIVSFTYPEEVTPGATFDVVANVKNNGAGSETFTLVLVNRGTSGVLSRSSAFTLAAGASKTNATCPTALMPATDLNARLELWRTV